jgi:hypothetical protein
MDISGLSGQVANVITKAAGVSGQWEWRPDVRARYTNPQVTRGNVSVSGAVGRMDYTVGLTNNGNHSGAGGPTVIYNADGTIRESRNDEWTGEFDAPTLNAQLAWVGASGAKANFNGRYQHVYFDYLEEGLRVGSGLPDRFRTVMSDEGGPQLRARAAITNSPSAAGRLKFIGLDRFTRSPVSDTVFDDYLDDVTPNEGVRFRRKGDEKERIARSEYRWKGWGGDLQVSGEYAVQQPGQHRGAVLPGSADGQFVAFPLPGGTATVQEDRYEVIRHLRPRAEPQPADAGQLRRRILQARAGRRGWPDPTFLRPKASCPSRGRSRPTSTTTSSSNAAWGS